MTEKENMLAFCAELMLEMTPDEADALLTILSDDEREVLVSEIFRQLHRDRAERVARSRERRLGMLIAPSVMLNLKSDKGGATVKYRGRVHHFDNMERALAFCECVRDVEESLYAGLGKKLSPVATYKREYPRAVDMLYPAVIKKTVTLCVEFV